MTTKTKKKQKKALIEGPITPQFIADAIAKHSAKTDIGAHNIFMGQVRNDIIDRKQVKAIEYAAYKEMAEEEFYKIRESAFEKYNIICMHIYHSLGVVKAGEISMFVFVSSKHRDDSYKASRYIVEEIKSKVPIFGKEIFEDDTHVWKERT